MVAIGGLGLMYPGVYRQLSGGVDLFLLICGVDVAIGPLLTGVIFSEGKANRELRRDLSVVIVLQIAALCYGLYVLAIARPIALVFEVDRFRVISLADVRLQELQSAPLQYQHLPWSGPWLLGARPAKDDERLDAIEQALAGYDIAQRPTFWQPYEEARHAAGARARPADSLLRIAGGRRSEIMKDLQAAGLAIDTARYLPIQSRQSGWIAWLDEQASPRLLRRYEDLM